MRKLTDKIKQLTKGIMFDLHGNMLPAEHNAVLIVVHIRRILKSPLIPLYGHRNDPVILSCGMIDPAGIAFIFPAQKTFGIT